MNRAILLLTTALCLLAIFAPAGAQSDALNLPTDLYVLLNEGTVQRYGLGAAGVRAATPPDTYVVDFAVAPDGTQIAYRTVEGMVIAPLGGDPPMAGTNVDPAAGVPPIRGRGETIAWTPQGDALAYTTLEGARMRTGAGSFADIAQAGVEHLEWSPNGRFLAVGVSGNIYWIYRRDDPALTLTAAIPFSDGITWVSDAILAFAPDTGGLFTMDLNAANAQTRLLDESAIYSLPDQGPDGRLRAFQRVVGDAETPEGYGRLVALDAGATQSQTLGQTPIDLRGGLRWAPGGELMIAFQGGVLALFDPTTGQGFPLPVSNAVAYGWGPYPPPVSEAAPLPTSDAIFPDTFPTMDPRTPIPGLATATPAAATEEAAS